MPKNDLQRQIDAVSTVIGSFSGSLVASGFDEVRADVWLALKTTDDITEGTTNLYFTDGRVSANADVAGNTAARHNAVTIGTGGLSSHLGITAGQVLTLSAINHADLSNIDPNQHIDHTAVSITGGTGITGGGAITTSRVLSIDTGYSVGWTARQYFYGGLDAADAEIYGELHSAVFVKDETAIHAGDIIVVKSAGTLAADYTVGGTMVIKDPPSGASWLFDSGDDVRIKAEHTAGMGDTWVTVTRTGTINTYTTTYKSGTNGIIYPAGTGVADYGTVSDGGIRIQSNSGLGKLPRIDGFVYNGTATQNPFFAVGDIAGISDSFFGTIPAGTNGLYAKDVYLTGQFNITNGQDITNIDGGNITTGTINASVVAVTNINASNITTGTINAGVIAVTNINASNITTGTINADNVTVSAAGGDVLVNNNGFSIYDITDFGFANPIAGLEWFDKSNSNAYLGGIYGLNDTSWGQGISLKGSQVVAFSPGIKLTTNAPGGVLLPGAAVDVSTAGVDITLVSTDLTINGGLGNFTITGGGFWDVTGGYKVNGTTVINNAGDWADDTGWVDFPFDATRWAHWDTGGWRCQYRRVGKTVSIVGLLNRTGSTGSDRQVGYLPADCRPPRNYRFVAMTGDANYLFVYLDVYPSGLVQLGHATNGNWHSIDMTFLIA